MPIILIVGKHSFWSSANPLKRRVVDIFADRGTCEHASESGSPCLSARLSKIGPVKNSALEDTGVSLTPLGFFKGKSTEPPFWGSGHLRACQRGCGTCGPSTSTWRGPGPRRRRTLKPRSASLPSAPSWVPTSAMPCRGALGEVVGD